MRKLFKKSLACCLALALCLTLFAGAITVNAELTTTPTYSTEEVSVVQGESTTIKFKLNDFSEIQGVILKVFVPEAVVSIDEVTAEGVTLEEWDDDEGSGNYEIDKDGKFVKFMSLANITDDDTVTAITFNIKVTVDAEAEAKSYDYPAPVIQATDGNVLVPITGSFADFVVTEKVVEPPVVECEHEWKVVSAAPGTAVDAPGHINFVCSKCNAEDNNEVTYHGTFRCAESSVKLESEIVLSYQNAKDRYNAIPSDAESGIEKGVMVFTDAEGEIVSTLDLVADREDLGTKYGFELKIPSYAMAQSFGGTSYQYCDGKWYSGKTVQNSIVGLIEYNFAGFDANRKKLFVDLLNYGAAVQTRFNIDTDALANATLTAEQLAYGSKGDAEFEAFEHPTVDNTTSIFTTSWALQCESKLVLKYTFNAKNFKNANGGLVDTLKPVVTFTDAWNNPVEKEYTFNGDLENVTLNVKDYVFNRVKDKTNQHEMGFLDFTACDFRTPITISFYDAEGTALETPVTVSVENLIASVYASSTANEKALFNAILHYGDSAVAVFAK